MIDHHYLDGNKPNVIYIMKKLHWISIALVPFVLWIVRSDFEGAPIGGYDDMDKGQKDSLSLPTTTEAKQLLESTCFACHNPKSESHDEMLAPPLVGIKRRYLREFEGRANFVEHLSAFVQTPSREAALMKGPIRRFGLMPKTALTKEQIYAVAEYIYDHELEAPEWFDRHHAEKHDRNGQQQ